MKDQYEEEIDRLLRGLARAETSTSMEGRILHHLQWYPMVSEQKPRLSWVWRSWLAGTLAVLVMAFALPHFHRLLPSPQAHAKAATVQALPAALGLQAPAAAVQAGRKARSRPALGTSPPVSDAEPEPGSRGAAALQSQLAPVAPLTEQERLLLRIAKGPGPAEVAALNPEIHDTLLAQSQAEFTNYFPQPTPQEIYLATHQSN